MTARDDERALLACALAGGPDAARELLRTVRAPMLADPGLARTWSALRRVLEAATGPVVGGKLRAPDLVDAVATAMGGQADAPSRVDLHALAATAAPEAAAASRRVPDAAVYYARRVADAYARREAGATRSAETETERPRDQSTPDRPSRTDRLSRDVHEICRWVRFMGIATIVSLVLGTCAVIAGIAALALGW